MCRFYYSVSTFYFLRAFSLNVMSAFFLIFFPTRNSEFFLFLLYRYTHIPFTKFYDKYLPFTTSQVSDMLDRFFSQDTFTAALNTPGQIVRIDD